MLAEPPGQTDRGASRETNRPSAPVPGGRWSRLARLGSLAGGVAGSMLAEGVKQLAQGNRPKINELLLTPANARRVAEQLAQLRGAAMKVGQLLSMDAGELLPPVLAEILARLRADAIPMPMSQVVTVLNANWGEGWDRHFQQFSFTPTAAASIGQVHFGQRKDGRRVAVKFSIRAYGTALKVMSTMSPACSGFPVCCPGLWISSHCLRMPNASCTTKQIIVAREHA